MRVIKALDLCHACSCLGIVPICVSVGVVCLRAWLLNHVQGMCLALTLFLCADVVKISVKMYLVLFARKASMCGGFVWENSSRHTHLYAV